MNTTKNRLIQKLLLNKKGKKQNGFTLVELMVVIVIVGILTAVGLPELTKAQEKAKEMSAISELVNESKDCATAILFGDNPVAAGNRDNGDYTVAGDCETDGSNSVLSVAMGTEATDKKFTITIVDGVPGKPAEGVVG